MTSADASLNRRRCVAALDVGGTTMKGALLAEGGSAVHRESFPTPASAPEAVSAVVSAVGRLIACAPAGWRVDAVGLAVCGLVDESAGVGIFSENVGWRDVPFRDLVERSTGLPVAFGHDVRAAGLAEHRVGVGRGADSFVLVTVGTGVSAALVVGGRMVVGTGSSAGEIGHVSNGSGEPCVCGGIGCVEAVASASAIARRYQAAIGISVAGAQDVLERAEYDPVARRVWSEAVDALAVALAWICAVVDPPVIAVGGGLAGAASSLLEPLELALHARLPLGQRPRLVVAALGGNAGCTGAGLMAWDLLTDRADRAGAPGIGR